jgi:aldehyde dehydrogenase (NAD+)
MGAQLNYVPQWYYYYAGLADKVEGSTLPLDKKGYFALHAAGRPHRASSSRITAVELAAAAGRLVEVLPALAGRLHLRDQALRKFTSRPRRWSIAELFDEAGLPAGRLQLVGPGFGNRGWALAVSSSHPLVR